MNMVSIFTRQTESFQADRDPRERIPLSRALGALGFSASGYPGPNQSFQETKTRAVRGSRPHISLR